MRPPNVTTSATINPIPITEMKVRRGARTRLRRGI